MASKEIKEPFEDVSILFRIVVIHAISSDILGRDIAKNACELMNPDRAGEIAYKILCLHLKKEGIRISGNSRREIGHQAAMVGISTNEGVEFVKEITKDVFFSECAD